MRVKVKTPVIVSSQMTVTMTATVAWKALPITVDTEGAIAAVSFDASLKQGLNCIGGIECLFEERH